ncbi:MAG: hypothetical protein C4520_01605 [Candidatus Abyssobacteria bacterium SURF_5]|uniref:Lipoprotein n=1 Tax=Abyssobacteria bacterium (strain SURF_5) TaxID=2093360 RepID=A0A3A4PD03_ABYX5|nr:MAG: hypothetical protein C4520_01605 [Candidatus Abyssubacteria bacterium SURF_5]
MSRKILPVLLLLIFSAGCALFDTADEERELLPVRNVKAVPFPVRPLEFKKTDIRQDKDLLIISGSVENVSYSPVAGVVVRAVVFLATDQTTEAVHVPAVPSVLQPGESAEFFTTALVDQPVSQVELHLQWESYYPPGL